MPFDPMQPIGPHNYPGMPDDTPPGDTNTTPPAGEGDGARPSLLQPTGDADKDRAIIIRFFGDVFRQGFEDARDRWGWTDDELNRIMESQGLSPEQITNLKENEQFRNGIRSGELPSPDLRNALNNIDALRGRMNEVLDAGGRTERTTLAADRAKDLIDTAGFGRNHDLYRSTKTAADTVSDQGDTPAIAELWRMGRERLEDRGITPDLRRGLDQANNIVASGGATAATAELWRMGSKLVKERGFTPEFRAAFDRLLDVVIEDGSGQTGSDSIIHPAFAQLQKIIQSEGAEGAGILPLEQVVGLVEAQAGQRSAEIAEAAQLESARRGLGPGAVTSGTEVGAESGQLQLNQETQAVAQAIQGNQALRGQAISSALQNLTKLAEIQKNDPVRGRQADVLGELIRGTVTNIQTGASLGVGAQRLQNEQLALGLKSTADLSGIAAGREATGAQLTLGAQGLQNERYRIGMEGVRDLSSIAAGRESTAFQSLLGAEEAEFANRQLATSTIAGGNQVQAGAGVDLQRQVLDSLSQSGATAQYGQQNYLNAINMQRLPAFAQLDLARTAIGGLGGPAGIQSGPPWWHGLIAGIPGAIGGAIPTGGS